MSGGGSDTSGALQARNEQLETERQNRVRAGANLINTNFARFDDNFFNDFQDKFMGFFEPQLDTQSAAAGGKATTALIDRGILGSTEGIRALTDLQDRDALERTNLANRGIDERNRLRSGLENEKSNLFALNEAAADPQRVAPLVEGAATAFAAPASFSPLEDVFGSTLNSIAAFQGARNNAVSPTRQRFFPTATGGSSGGSGRVVG